MGPEPRVEVSEIFVDPRIDPDPRSPRPPARFTSNPDELADLQNYCQDGRLYDVERWIRAGGPLQLAPGTQVDHRRRFRTALSIALDRRDHALTLLLIANGYDWSAEAEFPLDTALRLRDRDLLDFFLDWGADPRQVNVHDLCDSYDTELYERFRNLGVDLTSDHALAHALGYHTSNKPLFGFAKRHRSEDSKIQFDLDVALAHHAWEGNEKGVLLSLWAGADAHAQVPVLRWGLDEDEDEEDRYSAVYAACSGGHPSILERFEPDPARDDFEELYSCAHDEDTVRILASAKLPADQSRVVMSQLHRSAWTFHFRDERPVRTLAALFDVGIRWGAGSKEDIADVRRSLLRSAGSTFEGMMKLLSAKDYCSQEVLTELARTPAIRRRMKERGLIPDEPGKRSRFDRSRPSRARRKLDKFGVKTPKLKKVQAPLPRAVRIGGWGRNGQDLEFDRQALFDRVWSTPVETLAGEWSLSGRGLAKACRRIKVPVPPRGYWAKVRAGQHVRRPKLPKLPEGQAEVVIVHVKEQGTD